MRTALATGLASLVLGLGGCPGAARADGVAVLNQVVNQAMATGGNTSTIIQLGNGNVAETDQTGAHNYAEIGQFGDGNRARIVQNSIAAIAVYGQFGNGNTVTITQTGVRPQPVIVIQHR